MCVPMCVLICVPMPYAVTYMCVPMCVYTGATDRGVCTSYTPYTATYTPYTATYTPYTATYVCVPMCIYIGATDRGVCVGKDDSSSSSSSSSFKDNRSAIRHALIHVFLLYYCVPNVFLKDSSYVCS